MPDGTMIMNDENVRIEKRMSWLILSFNHSPAETEENHEDGGQES
jgi:hypothetical protein